MRFHARIGVLPHERELSQPLEVDLSVWVTPGAGGEPSAIDYRALFDRVASTVDAGHHELLESLAHRVASSVFTDTDPARVRVAVRKPHVPLPGLLDHAEVVVELERDG